MYTQLPTPPLRRIEKSSVLDTIGNTPLIHLKRLSSITGREVYAKMEMANPGGSIKDRTSLAIVEEGIRKGHFTKDTTLIESSSGNMAVGLAQVCCYYNIPLIIVVDPKANPHTLKILNAYGAKINNVQKPIANGGYLGARLARIQELLLEIPNSVWTNQYQNESNPKAHHRTMREIYQELPEVDYVFAATSTCGTLMGCANYIQAHGLNTKMIAVDAVGSVLFGHKPQERHIPGHGAGLPSHFLRREAIESACHISDMECVEGCHKLLDTEGILAGGSSGAVLSAFLKLQQQLPENSKSVLILCDRGERYLDTLYNQNWVQSHLK
ncbi:2,3-diaminopropionate biosynthesis protein SbnA [Leeuwenhoekiella palythoae]|uniref:N-(2-amino-2-carboxyethyl)-L-glutamate synthase n=1 Tax=Leeuwenhoekiella palythoae TaxID=573501 RepID=A0A1M5Y9X9_9FLAO|nr:2,3-diaminopropionate biosynthesis protein SbnA [Leeuwenhoekiella palythoae]RXG30592.1 cysteine synthase A [Leeuwenhoekiella palythoae]SHI08855.1 cysteine synthase A [Leeuwenhoekiella palythoae]